MTDRELTRRRDAIFAQYDSGAFSALTVRIKFIALMIEATDDETALVLCESIPEWFGDDFREFLVEHQDEGYGFRWFRLGDPRNREQVEADAQRYGEYLGRMGPQILAII